jgi:protoporphyrinogen IX oxidase
MLWIKSLHVIFIVSWFAGLFYLPRIFVNLAMETDQKANARLLLMGRKLFRFMNILVVPALGFGIWLWLAYGFGAGQGWVHAKLTIAVILAFYHHGCGVLLRKFENGQNKRDHKWYRWFNEIPTIGLFAAVFLAVLKPF